MLRERLLQDLRFAARGLRRDRSFTVIALVTLALGIAATVTSFAVTKAVLLDPLPFPDPGRLVMVWERTPAGSLRNFTSSFNLLRWRERNQVFDSIGGITQMPINVTGLQGTPSGRPGDALQVDGLAVTAGFFRALGVAPLIGDPIREQDERTFPPRRVVVLSYGFWQQQLGGTRNVIGRTVMVNGAPSEVVGVMPAGFAFPAARAAHLYVPLPINPAAPPGGRSLITVARIKPGVSLDAAQADMARVVAQLIAEGTPNLGAGWSASVFPLLEESVGSMQRVLWVVSGAVACLLLLACANVANLLLIRSGKRGSEIAVRLALGASRGRIVFQLTVENLMLTLGAGAIGLGLAFGATRAIPSWFPSTFPLPRAGEIALDPIVIVMTVVGCGAIALTFSLLPVIRTVQDRLAAAVRSAARTSLAAHSRLRRAMVVFEVAVALVLTFAAALMGSSLAELTNVDPGFRADRVLTLRMLMVPARYAGADRSRPVTFLNRVLDEIRAIPEAVGAGSVHFLPLSGVGSGGPVFRADRPRPAADQLRPAPISVVTDGYFSAMGIPLLQGRDFSRADRLGAPTVTIVNESLARQLFPNENPLGKYLAALYSPATERMEIVGVVGDVRTSTLDRAPGPALYIAHSQEPSLSASIVVRMKEPSAPSVAAIRAAIARVDPEQGVAQVEPLETVLANAAARPRVQARVFGVFGILALVIAGVGLYGVMAYSVEQRRRELGLQVALGAAPRALLASVIGEGGKLTVIGAVVGTGLAWLAGRSLEGLLYETRANDPVILAGVVLTLITVGCAATLGPALRATRVDPLVVLREE